MVAYRDKKLTFINELLVSVDVIKFYCWEQPFQSMVNSQRRGELRCIDKVMRLIAALGVCFGTVPILLQIVTFFVEASMGKLTPLSAAMGMTSLGMLTLPIIMMTVVVQFGLDCKARAPPRAPNSD